MFYARRILYVSLLKDFDKVNLNLILSGYHRGKLEMKVTRRQCIR
jgi:hypothetical protein